MKTSRFALFLAAVALAIAGGCVAPAVPRSGYADEPDVPPTPREFRGAWVASVANIDWPSRRGLSTSEQQAEIVAIVRRARELNLNALIVQVRPAADALYPSALEPWSEYLTGEQGRPPEPPWDPLDFWIAEAHRAGIELHAWFNPYRARHSTAKSPPSANHVARTHPEWVKTYGEQLWLDPSQAGAAQRTLDVILDVVRRYDVDGVHIDDYFYPYPVVDPASRAQPPADLDFPDDASWQPYFAAGGLLSRADWRRHNVDELVLRLYEGIHREKSWVRFGVSPFGIGRPDRRPPDIEGFSQYDKLYADVELWLANCWVDYLAPQLYWPRGKPGQDFATLLDYWVSENACERHVWPGLYTSRIDASDASWMPEEIVEQVALVRAQEGAGGHAHFSMAALMGNRRGIADRLKAGPYATPALPPASPWLGTAPPPVPTIVDVTVAKVAHVRLDAQSAGSTVRYAVWSLYGTRWNFTVLPASATTFELPGEGPTGALATIAISAVDRLGNESERVFVRFAKNRNAP